jgi:hypothetical protein
MPVDVSNHFTRDGGHIEPVAEGRAQRSRRGIMPSPVAPEVID